MLSTRSTRSATAPASAYSRHKTGRGAASTSASRNVSSRAPCSSRGPAGPDEAGGGSPAIGDAVDFHLAIHHHARHHARPRWWIGAEIFGEDLVEALKVSGIVEPDAATHDILGLVTGLGQD